MKHHKKPTKSLRSWKLQQTTHQTLLKCALPPFNKPLQLLHYGHA